MSIADLGRDEIASILTSAESFEAIGEREIKKVPTLRGTHGRKSLLRELDAHARVVRARRETAVGGRDQRVGGRIERAQGREPARHRSYAARAGRGRDRPASSGRRCAGACSRVSPMPAVINAGDGAHEHPTQALLDMYTVQRRLRNASRVCVSASSATSRTRGSRDRTLWGSGAWEPTSYSSLRRRFSRIACAALGCRWSHDLDAELPSLDVIYLLRMQRERHRDAAIPSRA